MLLNIKKSTTIHCHISEDIIQDKKRKLECSEDVESMYSAQTSRADISTSVNSADTPRKIRLRKTLFNERKLYERQIRTLKQKNKRQAKKIVTLSFIINDLKEKGLLEEEHLYVLQTIDQSNVQLFKRFAQQTFCTTN